MRKTLLTILLTLIVWGAPWRLMWLATEIAWLPPGQVAAMPTGNSDYWKCQSLELRLRSLGWQVLYETDLNIMTMRGPEKVYGLTDPSEHTIRIEKALSWDARFRVLAHEGGHTLQPWWLNYSQGDSFAESVSALVTGHSREQARWLSSDKVSTIYTLMTEWPRIYTAAAVLENR